MREVGADLVERGYRSFDLFHENRWVDTLSISPSGKMEEHRREEGWAFRFFTGGLRVHSYSGTSSLPPFPPPQILHGPSPFDLLPEGIPSPAQRHPGQESDLWKELRDDLFGGAAGEVRRLRFVKGQREFFNAKGAWGEYPFSWAEILLVTPTFSATLRSGDVKALLSQWREAKKSLQPCDGKRLCRASSLRFSPWAASQLLDFLIPYLYRLPLYTWTGNPSLSLFDDPLLAGGSRGYPFDGEGVPAQRRAILSKGTVVGRIVDARSSFRDGGALTGNLARIDPWTAPLLLPSNVELILDETTDREAPQVMRVEESDLEGGELFLRLVLEDGTTTLLAEKIEDFIRRLSRASGEKALFGGFSVPPLFWGRP